MYFVYNIDEPFIRGNFSNVVNRYYIRFNLILDLNNITNNAIGQITHTEHRIVTVTRVL